jgi:hypothetical protein
MTNDPSGLLNRKEQLELLTLFELELRQVEHLLACARAGQVPRSEDIQILERCWETDRAIVSQLQQRVIMAPSSTDADVH